MKKSQIQSSKPKIGNWPCVAKGYAGGAKLSLGSARDPELVEGEIGNSPQSGAGQSLFEVVFAIAVASLVITGIVSLSTTSVRNATFARNKSLASRFTQEASEWLRGERDSGWDSFASRAALLPGTTWCLRDTSWPGADGSCGSSDFITGTSIFKREATLTEISANDIQADIIASWQDAQGVHEVRNVTRFTDWRTQ